MKACIKYLIGLAILGLAGLVNASPMPEADFNEHEFDLLNITLPQTNMSEMGYDPSFEYHDSSTIQIWMGKKKTAVGSMVGADLYRKVWGLLDAACPADSKFGECTDPKYVQFESRCLRTWPGGVVPCYTDIYDVYARWDSENIRKLLIGAVAGTLEAITNRPVTGPTNCYDMAGTKACNVGDVIRVNFPNNGADAKKRNYMHISLYNYWSNYGNWDCCEGDKRQLVDKAIDPLGEEVIREFPQYWGKQFTRDTRCIINGWEVCKG